MEVEEQTADSTLPDNGQTSESCTQKEMDELEEAINNSRISASLEEKQREWSSTAEQKSAQKSPKTAKTGNGSEIENASDDSYSDLVVEKKNKARLTKAKSADEFKLAFQELQKATITSLDIVYHTPVFNLPIAFDPKYQSFTLQQKAQLLSHYFARIGKLRSQLAQHSLNKAPWSKPIEATGRTRSASLRNGIDEDFNFDDFLGEPQNTYTSRSGRQVKRKIYTEDAETDSDADSKFNIKKNKHEDLDTKLTLDLPYIPEEDFMPKTPPKVAKKRETQKKLTSFPLKKKETRSDLLFEKMLEDGEKKKQQEAEMEIFHRSLQSVDEEDSEEFKENESEAAFVRQRVPPPLPIKRGRAKKNLKLEVIEENDKEEGGRSSPVLGRSANSKLIEKAKAKTQKAKEIEKKVAKLPCPICNKEFPQNEIETHASNCGIDDDNSQEVTSSINRANTIACNLCDKVFFMNSDYEEHVRNCIAAKITND